VLPSRALEERVPRRLRFLRKRVPEHRIGARFPLCSRAADDQQLTINEKGRGVLGSGEPLDARTLREFMRYWIEDFCPGFHSAFSVPSSQDQHRAVGQNGRRVARARVSERVDRDRLPWLVVASSNMAAAVGRPASSPPTSSRWPVGNRVAVWPFCTAGAAGSTARSRSGVSGTNGACPVQAAAMETAASNVARLVGAPEWHIGDSIDL